MALKSYAKMDKKSQLQDTINWSGVEIFVLTVYIFSLFLGLWHAFPNMDVVSDESGPYVWNVLDAFKAGTVVPHMDYSYTISFYINYIIMGLVGLLFFGGDIASLASYVGYRDTYLLLLPRLATVIVTILLLVLFLRLVQRQTKSLASRLSLVVLVFTDIIFVVIAHTGKMWLFSLFLFFASFYFLTEAFRRYQELAKLSWYRSPILHSIIFAFLAFANFPFNIIALLNVVYIYYFFYHQLQPLRKLINLATLAGLAIFVLTFLLNRHGWSAQNSLTPTGSLELLPTFIFRYLIEGSYSLMPLLLVSLFLNTRRIVEKRLFWITSSYLLSYLLLLAFRATWIGPEASSYWRYLLYPTFFVGTMLLFTEVRSRYVLYLCVLVSLVFFVKTIYLLAVPTTYNIMLEYVKGMDLENSLLVNRVPQLDIHWRKGPEGLGYIVAKNDVNVPQIRDEVTKLTDAQKYRGSYLISEEQADYRLIYKADNNFPDNYYASIENNLGPYDYRLLLLNRLGKPLYLYDFSSPK